MQESECDAQDANDAIFAFMRRTMRRIYIVIEIFMRGACGQFYSILALSGLHSCDRIMHMQAACN